MYTLTLRGTPMIEKNIGLVWNNYNRWRWVNGDSVSGGGVEKVEIWGSRVGVVVVVEEDRGNGGNVMAHWKQ